MISVFDMFKIGIGPSSSHTVGPMRAALSFSNELVAQGKLSTSTHITTQLFGSLGQTGKGHGTGKAIILGLLGYTPENVPVQSVDKMLLEVSNSQRLLVQQTHSIAFPNAGAIVFHRRKTLPKHANGMTLSAYNGNQLLHEVTYYSIGGGFIVEDSEFEAQKQEKFAEAQMDAPFPFSTATELLSICQENSFRISTLMFKNETMLMDDAVIRK